MRRVERRSSNRAYDELKHYIQQSGSYAPQNETRVIHDLAECRHLFPTLHPIIDNFTASDGKVQRLVALRGTVPITYKAATYKIPVHIWVMPYHPTGPPLIFVVPTRSMVFRQRHQHVDVANGLVYLPYLSSWDALTSNLSGAVNQMIDVFSLKPPVYTRDAQSAASQEEAERRKLIQDLSGKLSNSLSRSNEQASYEVGKMLNRKHTILRKETERQALRRQRSRDKFVLEGSSDRLQSSIEELHKWHLRHPEPPSDVPIDETTRPRTMLREQNIELRAEDFAQTDALDQIDEAVSRGVIDNETYMREVRRVARDQFFTRALQRKVQQQIAVTEAPDGYRPDVPTVMPPPPAPPRISLPPAPPRIPGPGVPPRPVPRKPGHATYKPLTG